MDFVPLGSELTALAQLTGHVYWEGDPVRGASVDWEVPVDGLLSWGTTTTADDGGYVLDGVPPASADGVLAATWGTDLWGPYTVGREAASWPGGETTVFDIDPVKVTLQNTSGGPWSIAAPRLASLHGSDSASRLFSYSGIEFNGNTGNYPLTLRGLVDTAAVYYWANEGVEYNARISTADGAAIDRGATYLPAYVAALDASTAIMTRADSIYRTQDAGLTWSWVKGGTCGPVDFADSLHGWATVDSGVRLLATSDGGLTWSLQSPYPAGQIRSIAAVDALHVWIVGLNGAIHFTTDGGATWTQQSSGVTSRLSGVDFADLDHGWACGAGGVILTTSDGGATWTRQKSGTTMDLQDVVFTDAQHGFAVGGAYDPIAQVVLTTSDGGATWVKRTTGTSQPLWAVDATGPASVWVAGEKGMMLRTSDGGATWTRQRPATTSSVGPLVWSIDMLDDQRGWAAGEFGTMIATTDGGASWARQLNLNSLQARAQRVRITAPYWQSGKPGARVTLLLSQFGKGVASALTGYCGYPADAPLTLLGSHTSTGAASQEKTVTIPTTAKPGYLYLVGVQHKDGVLYLEVPFQVCTLKPSSTSIRVGAAIRLSGTVPTQGHWGLEPGRTKLVTVYRRTTVASPPKVWDATTVGWKKVGTYRTDGYGKFTTPLLKPGRTTWYIVRYPGDEWYWGAYTSVAKVTVY